MNKTVSLLLTIVSILTIVPHSASYAAEREYSVPMENSKWIMSSKENYECILSQVIPFYGEGQFIHKSGYKVKFSLLSDEAVMDDDVKIIIQSEPPAWRHDDKVFEIGKFNFERGHNPLIIQSPFASRMLQQIENGMSPVVLYRDMADGRDIIAVMLSPINFRKALTEYRACEKTLMDFDLDEIKHLKLYFASNKDVLTARSRRDLKNITRYLEMDPTILQIKVDAHADSRGRRRFNDNLSERRSESVVKYLLSVGVKAEMIYAVSHGEREPEHSNKTALGRSKNRRVDVSLLTVAPPTPEEREAIEANRKAERRRELTERSIFNQSVKKSQSTQSSDDSQPQKNEDISRSSSEQSSNEDSPQTSSEFNDNEVFDNEPPVPNFINFDHLVDKNNQKVNPK